MASSPHVVIAGLDPQSMLPSGSTAIADWTPDKPMRSMDRRVKPGGDETE
jgi:hypothetical protein